MGFRVHVKAKYPHRVQMSGNEKLGLRAIVQGYVYDYEVHGP